MVQQKKTASNVSNGINRELPTMSFQKKDVSNARVVGNSGKGDARSNGSATPFGTDAAISQGRSGRERVLQPWVGPSESDGADLSLEKSTGGGAWDQFAANEAQFGIKSTYDENIYTTAIDKSHPQYRERVAAADRKAREIERSVPTYAHVAEERKMDYSGGADDKGGDEEDKYSGVKRQGFPAGNREDKYTPPARRAPTAASSVKGAPVDPAIISSQLKSTQKPQPAVAAKADDDKTRPVPKSEVSPAPTTTQASDSKPDTATNAQQKPAESKSANQSTAALRPSAATSRTISPQGKEGQPVAPNATATVERDVLKEFKTFANRERMTADKIRSTKAKQDKEVKLTELKKFADSFKLPTPVPVDLIGIIAKDPIKQREIQEKAERDVAEVAKRKAEEAVAKDKKAPLGKDVPPHTTAHPTGDTKPMRPVSHAPGPAASAPGGAPGRPGGRMAPPYANYGRPGSHMPPNGRAQGSLTARIRNMEQNRAQAQMQDMRMMQPPTGPANAANPSFARGMGMGPMGGKLNPNSHEFRPNAFAPSFSPNGHPSASSSPRSALNHANDAHHSNAQPNAAPLVISKKRKAVDPKKCDILGYAKSLPAPETKNYNDNDGLRPSYDTQPTWRSAMDEERPDSTMRLDYNQYFERQPFNNAQPTPNPPHLLPQHVPHQHQLPLHMQHGGMGVGSRHSPHVPPVPMHGGQHGPMPNVPYNAADDHRMMPSGSQQSYQSPRMAQVPVYQPAMQPSPGMPYNQGVMPSFMAPNGPPMNQVGRSYSHNAQYMPQPSGGMAPMMMHPQFMGPGGMVAGPPQMPMYPGQPFMNPGAGPQPMPGSNGYPSPGRPAAPMMVHQGSQQGQPMYGQSPSMQFQQPYTPQQGQSEYTRAHPQPGRKLTQGSVNNMRPYGNAQQFGSSPQQMHSYGGPPHRNGGNNFNKNYQGHNQHHGPQGGHPVPTGPQGRPADGPDEAK
ncbi:hypothetical protein F4780DRAFT_222330 [Xylariomycetidae sp. FL0641]|nr:hypothetical protein F4780DRAFT_222330 [Xylariomycetidae sp. FL0641]